MWKPSTVEDIQAWLVGTYVPNPTAEEVHARMRRIAPRMCLIPKDHPSQQERS
jgi:hypothetical protein